MKGRIIKIRGEGRLSVRCEDVIVEREGGVGRGDCRGGVERGDGGQDGDLVRRSEG